MKKTISIHLMGTNFLVEEDAYELVKNYLDRLNHSLRNSSDRKEICEDVELRIAELATSYVNAKKEVVSFEEMQQILETLGQPEDFLEEEMHGTQEKFANDTDSEMRSEKRLFRDLDNGMIAGVCSGLAAYFRVDVAVFRIIFVLLGFAGGFIVPLYIIMWVAVPRAKTNLERLQMHGRPINLETLKEEFEDAAQRLSKTGKKFESEFADRNSPVRRRISTIGRTIAKLAGLALMIFGSISLIMLLFFGIVDIRMFPFADVDTQLTYKDLTDLVLLNDANAFYLWLGGFTAALSFVLFMILLGAMLLFRLKSKWVKRSFLLLVLIGITGIIISTYQGVKLGSDFALSGEYEQKIGETADSVLYIRTSESIHPDHVKGRNYRFDGEFFDIKNGQVIESGIDINYENSEDSSFHVYVEYSALGNSKKKAVARSKNIQHEVTLEGNQLIIAPFYKYPKSDKVRNQSVSLTILIPAGKTVEFKNFKVFSDDIRDWGYIEEGGEYEHYNNDDDDDFLHLNF